MSALSIPKPQMEIFPGAYVAKLSMGAAGALGALVIAILSYRTDSAVSTVDQFETPFHALLVWYKDI